MQLSLMRFVKYFVAGDFSSNWYINFEDGFQEYNLGKKVSGQSHTSRERLRK